MNASDKASKLLPIIQGICLLAIAVAVVKREFFSADAAAPAAVTVPLSDKDWKAVTSAGHVIGNPKAPVKVVMFADLECPGCRQFETTTLRSALKRHHDDIAVIFRHYPIVYHKEAYSAARASECAATQGKFAEFIDSVYDDQQALGRRSFGDFATAAGVGDIDAFNTCFQRTDSLVAIQADVAIGDLISVTATPTIIVSGDRLTAIPDSAQFEGLIARALKKARR